AVESFDDAAFACVGKPDDRTQSGQVAHSHEIFDLLMGKAAVLGIEDDVVEADRAQQLDQHRRVYLHEGPEGGLAALHPFACPEIYHTPASHSDCPVWAGSIRYPVRRELAFGYPRCFA